MSASQHIVTSIPTAEPAARREEADLGPESLVGDLVPPEIDGHRHGTPVVPVRLVPDRPEVLVVPLRPRLDPESVSDRQTVQGAERVLHALEVAHRHETPGPDEFGQALDALRPIDVDRELRRRVMQRVHHLGRRYSRIDERAADPPPATPGMHSAV
ncbi:hypothetical protein [Amycolatopsis sp. WAC 01375]|uniref:hypothetical protein n=1 Tax=Amycolatopsis sp. WAC 01375 TaxID=2203194 RepID=UPI001F228372|nr:hypothetical protein [Amycolatopsis sp. WAC 01375]